MAHWYTKDGELHQYIENASKPGTLRSFTLRDARKINAIPSTTTKLGIINKFILNEWLMNEAIKRAINETIMAGRSDNAEQIYDKVKHDIAEYSSWAANFGTRVHKTISSLYGGEPYAEPELDELDLLLVDNVIQLPGTVSDFTKVNAVALATKDWMDANGFECLDTEYTFVNKDLGSAGTVDWIGLHFGQPCTLDFKTQDAGSTKDFNQWPETGLQLADYVRNLCWLNYTKWEYFSPEKEEVERISIYTSRTNPGVIFPYQWTDVNDFKKMEMISEYWFLDKKYDPRKESNDPVQESLI